MSVYNELAILFDELEDFLRNAEYKASVDGKLKEAVEYSRKRKFVEQALHLYAFTQLEASINRKYHGATEGLEKTLFNEYNSRYSSYIQNNANRLLLDNKRINLMDKVTFMQPSGNTTYNAIKILKDQRDTIAHGNILNGADILSLFEKLGSLDEDLSKGEIL